MGKSRAAAFALGLQDIDEGAEVNTYSDNNDSYDPDINPTAPSEGSACLTCTTLIIMSIKSIQAGCHCMKLLLDDHKFCHLPPFYRCRAMLVSYS